MATFLLVFLRWSLLLTSVGVQQIYAGRVVAADDALFGQRGRGDVAFSFKTLSEVTLPPELCGDFNRAEAAAAAAGVRRGAGLLATETTRLGMQGLETPISELSNGLPLAERLVSGLRNELAPAALHAKP